VLDDVVGHVERVHEVPPGVDVELFRPEPRAEALRNLLHESRADPPNDGDERLPDSGNAERLEAFFADDTPVAVYFGKLIRNKGVQLLLDAVRGLDARALIVGFGDYREELERMAPPGTLFTGALEHRHLVHLLPLTDVCVVPSIFPEAFGMVAAEAAAAGVPPLVARHSGLAEIAAGIESDYPAELRDLASFTDDLASKLRRLLELPGETRRELGLDARRAVVERWSWSSVAERLLTLHLG
jgi:glycosyltransferase involved in cell wall biosynthesis